MLLSEDDRDVAFRAIRQGEQLLHEFQKPNDDRGIVGFLAAAKIQAIDAMVALAAADPDDAKTIRDLQNEVRRYQDMRRWVNATHENMKQALEEIDEGDSVALKEHLAQEFGELADA